MTVIQVLFPAQEVIVGRITLAETANQVITKMICPALILILIAQTIGG
jgi:hypothetical protein